MPRPLLVRTPFVAEVAISRWFALVAASLTRRHRARRAGDQNGVSSSASARRVDLADFGHQAGADSRVVPKAGRGDRQRHDTAL